MGNYNTSEMVCSCGSIYRVHSRKLSAWHGVSIAVRRVISERYPLLVLVLIMAMILPGCKKDSDNPGGEYEVAYTWTPAGSASSIGPIFVTYSFHCMENDPDQNCDFFYYENVPHTSGNWMSMPKEGSTCHEFIAVIKEGDGTEYTFMGLVQEPLEEGWLRVTGNYDKYLPDGSWEVGTFLATSTNIKGGTCVCGSNCAN